MPSTVTTASRMKSGAVSDLPAGRPGVVLPDESDSTGRPTTKSTSGTTHPAEREQRPREVDLRDERKVRERGSGSRGSDAEAKYCIGSTPATTRLGYGVVPAGKFANLPKTIT